MAGVARFAEALCATFARAGVNEDSCHFDAASGQLVVTGSTTRVVPVPAICAQYEACKDEAARESLLAATTDAFVHGASDVPADYEACGERLLPQLWPIEKITARQATLPGGFQLPHCGTHGEEPPLRPQVGGEGHEFGVVLVCEYLAGAMGEPFTLPPIETPVLSSDLARWGVSFVDALRRALDNLRSRTKAGLPAAQRWEHHPSGCGQTAQSDRFDAARCALLPKLVTQRKRPDGAPEPGGHVVAFATPSCVLATTSKNPLGLCFLGDTLNVQLGGEDGKAKGKLLSATPYRLLKMRDGCVGEGKMDHPLTQKASEGFVWRWLPYTPGGPPLRAEGEFSVPIDQNEVDAILNAAEAGKPVPVFKHEEKAAGAGSGSTFAAKKEEANALFKAGDYVKAIAAYDAALAAGPPSDADAAVAHANAAQALLNLAVADEPRRKPCAAEAFRRAHLATQLDPNYAKAHARVAAAADILGESAAAAEARAKVEACTKAAAASEAEAKAKAKAEAEEKRKALEAQREAAAAAQRRRNEREALLEREREFERQKQEEEAAKHDVKLNSMLGLDPALGGIGIGINATQGISAAPAHGKVL